MAAMENHKNSGGNTMSLKTRFSLLASSSLAAAGVAAAVSLGAVLIPASAAAQTCSPSAVTVAGSGPGADIVNCTAGTFATGITYGSNGDLSVNLLAGGNSTITANGVNLTGNGADNVIKQSGLSMEPGGNLLNQALDYPFSEKGKILVTKYLHILKSSENKSLILESSFI